MQDLEKVEICYSNYSTFPTPTVSLHRTDFPELYTISSSVSSLLAAISLVTEIYLTSEIYTTHYMVC